MAQMPISKNSERPGAHGSVERDLSAARSDAAFEGKFGRVFRALPPASYDPKDLHEIGLAMTADVDPLKDEPDAEENSAVVALIADQRSGFAM